MATDVLTLPGGAWEDSGRIDAASDTTVVVDVPEGFSNPVRWAVQDSTTVPAFAAIQGHRLAQGEQFGWTLKAGESLFLAGEVYPITVTITQAVA